MFHEGKYVFHTTAEYSTTEPKENSIYDLELKEASIKEFHDWKNVKLESSNSQIVKIVAFTCSCWEPKLKPRAG
jgi:hypothetical protein